MYNTAQKRRYLQSLMDRGAVSNSKQTEAMFNVMGQFEEQVGKDLSLFSNDEVADLYAFASYGTIRVYRTMQSNLSRYVDWCINEGLVPDCQNRYNLGANEFEKFLNKNITAMRFMDREFLLRSISGMINIRDACFLLSLFEFGTGRSHRDIFTMKISDIDVENRKLRLYKRTVDVSDDWIGYALKTVDEKIIYDYPQQGQFQEETKKHILESGTYIYRDVVYIKEGIRDFDDNVPNRRVTKMMNQRFRKMADYLGFSKAVNESSIIDSGRICYIKQNAKKLGMSVEDYMATHEGDIRNQFGITFLRTNFIRQYRDYLT